MLSATCPSHCPALSGGSRRVGKAIPPTSGPHVAQTVAPGVYREEIQVHALEHGHVVVQYAPFHRPRRQCCTPSRTTGAGQSGAQQRRSAVKDTHEGIVQITPCVAPKDME
jgi:hypothetical protein